MCRHIFLLIILVFNSFSVFSQKVQNKNKPVKVDTISAVGENKPNKEETASFSPTQIDDILKKINYKKNLIVITVPNKIASSKTTEKPKPFDEPEVKSISKTQITKEEVVKEQVLKEQIPEKKDSSEKKTIQMKMNITTKPISSPAKDSADISQISTNRDTSTVPKTQNEKPIESVVTFPEVKTTEPTKIVSNLEYKNPFKSEEAEQKILTTDEQIEKTYSELLVKKPNNLLMMANNQEDLSELPPLDASTWKNSTKISVQQAEMEITVYKSRINRSLANYYPGNNSIDDSHAFIKNHNLDSLNKELVKSYYLMGLAYFKALDLQQSAETFKKVTQLYPDLDKSYKNISLIYETNKNFGEEIKKIKSSFFTSERKRD